MRASPHALVSSRKDKHTCSSVLTEASQHRAVVKSSELYVCYSKELRVCVCVCAERVRERERQREREKERERQRHRDIERERER